MKKTKVKEDPKPGPQKKPSKTSSSSKSSNNKKKYDLKNTSYDFFIVGIRASAGGLDAIERFFKNMPQESGLAFVVITHLSPNQESILPELIKKYTHVKAFLVDHGKSSETAFQRELSFAGSLFSQYPAGILRNYLFS